MARQCYMRTQALDSIQKGYTQREREIGARTWRKDVHFAMAQTDTLEGNCKIVNNRVSVVRNHSLRCGYACAFSLKQCLLALQIIICISSDGSFTCYDPDKRSVLPIKPSECHSG